MKKLQFNLFQYIGLRHIQLRPGRTLLTTLGVALGIALYVAIAIINHSTKNAMRESIEAVSGKAALSISAGVAGFQEEKLELIRVVDGIKSAVPMVEARAFFEGGTESTDGLYVLGVDLLQESNVRTYQATDQRIIDDPLIFLNQPDSIILTVETAKKKNLTIDSKVNLSTANGLKTFTIRGLLKPEGTAKAYGGSLAIMDIDGARMMFGKENKTDRIDIVLRPEAKVEKVREDLQKILGDSYRIESPASQSEQMERLIAAYQMILTFFSTLALLVGLFLVMNSISIAITERKKEIGTLRALGSTRFSMVYLFVSEVFMIGLIGSILGCFMGRLLADQLLAQVLRSLVAQFQTQIQVSRLEFTPKQIATSIALGTIASVVAAIFPALKAAAIHPLESMKKHAESFSNEDESRSRWLVFLGFVLLVLMSFSMIYEWPRYWLPLDPLSKGASVLGAALFGPFLVFILLHSIRGIINRLRAPILKLSMENLIRSRKRTSSNVTALMVGLYLVVLIATVRTSFQDTLMIWLDQVFVADVMITSNGRMITADVQPMREEVEKDILAIPGIRKPGLNHGISSRIVPYFHEGKKMMIKAFDHYAPFYEYRNFAVQSGKPSEIAPLIYKSEANMLVTTTFLTKQNKKVGDTIDLSTPSGKVAFKIVGSVTDFASPEGVIYLSRENYKKYWNDSMVTAFVINAESGHSVEEIRAAVDAAVGKKWNVVTISNSEFKAQMKDGIDRSFAYTRAIELIALLVGLLGLLSTMLISVLERTREIGTLRAVGSTKAQISKMIFTESVIQGFFGAVVAILLGTYVGKLFVEHGLANTLGWVIDFHFPEESILQTLFTGIIVAVIAAIIPAKRAANLQITEALSNE